MRLVCVPGVSTKPAPVPRRPPRCPGRLRDLAVLALLAAVLTACGVEAVEGDIADQQLCVAAQEVLRESAAGGSGSGTAVSDLRELAEGAADPELRSALAEVSEAYTDLPGEDRGSPVWDERDRAVSILTRVCQRLSAF